MTQIRAAGPRDNPRGLSCSASACQSDAMSATRQPACIHLWSGDFASQQLAFAHLLDTADRVGVPLDLDDVEIIPAPEATRRLAPYFDTSLPEVRGPVVILLATAPGTDAPFTDTERLAYIGAYEGRVLRAGTRWA